MHLTKRETATVLAALRHFQPLCAKHPDELGELSSHFADCSPLGSNEVNDLCERINSDDDKPIVLCDEDLIAAVRNLKAFGGDGGWDADDRVKEILDAADESETTAEAIIAVKGGVVQGVRSNIPLSVEVFDQDGDADDNKELRKRFEIPEGENIGDFWDEVIAKKYPVAAY